MSLLSHLSHHGALSRAALPHGVREQFEHRLALRPAEACIGDRYAVLERNTRLEVLTALFQMTLDHHAGNALLACFQLPRDILRDIHLTQMRLVRIGVRAVD